MKKMKIGLLFPVKKRYNRLKGLMKEFYSMMFDNEYIGNYRMDYSLEQ